MLTIAGSADQEHVVNWADVLLALQTPLPADYREFAERVGPAYLGEFLYVLFPGAANEPFDLLKFGRVMLDSLKEFEADIPYPIHPARGGLLPWGYTDWRESKPQLV